MCMCMCTMCENVARTYMCVYVWGGMCEHVVTLVHTILPSPNPSPPLPLPSPSPPSPLPSTPHRVSNAVKPPKELVVKVDLAGVRTVTDVELEVFERRLELHSQNPVYKLEVGVVKCVCVGCSVV